MVLRLFFVFLLFLGGTSHSQEMMYPYGAIAPVDADIKNLQWNRYANGKITVLSINDSDGKTLIKHAERIRSDCLERWGFPDNEFLKECRIFCVPDKFLMKKLFTLEQSKVEVRQDVAVIWLVANSDPLLTLPEYMTVAALSEFESKYKIKLGFWFKRGSSILNGVMPKVRQNLIELNESIASNSSIFVSEKMFSMTAEDYAKESVESRKIFDKQAVALCLMLRKEFGEAKLQGFLKVSTKNNVEEVLKIIYGFDNLDHFDKQYKRFIRDLTSDVVNNKTPDSYLMIRSVRK